MDPDKPLQFALENLADARRELERGVSVTGICDNISAAMYWAMEYWLSQKGHQPDFGNGWHSLHIQFVELTGGMAIDALSRCVHEAGSLDYRLHGYSESEDPDHTQEPSDWDAWRHDVAECIRIAEHLLDTLPPLPEFPQVFRFQLGGFGGPYHEIRWQGIQLYYRSAVAPGRGPLVPVMPDQEDWRQFWEAVDRLGVWEWPRRCAGNEEVCDGTQWELQIAHGDRQARSEGSNAYPFTREIGPSPEFREFVDAVSRLVNRPPFL